MIKCIFHEEKLNPIDTFCEKHILLYSRPACCGILIWQNLKGLAELANLTVLASNKSLNNNVAVKLLHMHNTKN